MVALDMFGRTKHPPLESKDLLRMGRLEAEVESLQIKWSTMRDELLKLVRRLEKRDERAAAKERAKAEADAENVQSYATEEVDSITARVLARRNHHAIPGRPSG